MALFKCISTPPVSLLMRSVEGMPGRLLLMDGSSGKSGIFKKKKKKKIDVWSEEYKSNESASAEVCN